MSKNDFAPSLPCEEQNQQERGIENDIESVIRWVPPRIEDFIASEKSKKHDEEIEDFAFIYRAVPPLA